MSSSEWKESELGRIPFEWDVLKIEEIADVISGGTPSTKNEENYGTEIAWITPKDLSGYSERYIEKGERSITKIGLENSSAKLLPANTILFSSRAPIGYVAIAKNELATNQGFKNLVCKQERAYYSFVYYKMKTLKEALESVAGGSTFKEVSGKIVKEFKIVLPPLEEQKAIANILSSLDEKIELNNQMNKTLEEIAQALFKRWFVDFEFPNEEGEPYKSSGGEMVDSELGMIPKGWKVGKAEEFFDITIGKTPPRKESQWFSNKKTDIKWVSISDMGNAGTFILDTSEYLTREAIEKHNVKIVPANTVLLSFKLTLGRVVITNEAMTTNEAIAHFKADSRALTQYIFSYLKAFNYETLGNTSSIAKAVNSKIIKAMPILMPQKDLIEDFGSIAVKLFERIQANQIENANLQEIRDTLLPKLMSGEIRVKDLQI